jgi:phosphohistidine swiveling domain-containing protein
MLVVARTTMIWAYVFISTRQPKNVVRKVRKIAGVLHADALFGSPDIIAVVAGSNIPEMDAVIDRIAEIPEIVGTDSKVARLLDGVEFPIKPRMRRA